MVGGMTKLTQGRAAVLPDRRQSVAAPTASTASVCARAASTAEERNEIKKLYKILYDPKLNVSQAIAAHEGRGLDRAGTRAGRVPRSPVRTRRPQIGRRPRRVRYFFSTGEPSGESMRVALGRREIARPIPQRRVRGDRRGGDARGRLSLWLDHTGWASMGPLAAIPRIPQAACDDVDDGAHSASRSRTWSCSSISAPSTCAWRRRCGAGCTTPARS